MGVWVADELWRHRAVKALDPAGRYFVVRLMELCDQWGRLEYDPLMFADELGLDDEDVERWLDQLEGSKRPFLIRYGTRFACVVGWDTWQRPNMLRDRSLPKHPPVPLEVWEACKSVTLWRQNRDDARQSDGELFVSGHGAQVPGNGRECPEVSGHCQTLPDTAGHVQALPAMSGSARPNSNSNSNSNSNASRVRVGAPAREGQPADPVVAELVKHGVPDTHLEPVAALMRSGEAGAARAPGVIEVPPEFRADALARRFGASIAALAVEDQEATRLWAEELTANPRLKSRWWRSFKAEWPNVGVQKVRERLDREAGGRQGRRVLRGEVNEWGEPLYDAGGSLAREFSELEP